MRRDVSCDRYLELATPGQHWSMDSQLNPISDSASADFSELPLVSLPNANELEADAQDTQLTAGPVETSDPIEPSMGDTFLSSVILLLGMTVAQKMIGFVRTIVVCRLLPPEEMGLWSMVQTTIATVLPIVLLSIPACFGRYFEFYRGRQQLQSFLKQAATLCTGLLVSGVVLLLVFRRPVAALTMGAPDLAQMIVYSATALVPFAVFCFLTEMLTALRYSRLTTIGHFINGCCLAILSITLLFTYERTAVAMLMAFAIAHLLALLWIASRLRPVLKTVPTDRQRLTFMATWTGLAPVILLFWFNDFMTNMFNMSDRYMLVNLIPGENSEVLRQIGNYESGHVIPVLFAAVTSLVAKTLMPYLANAWEKGQQNLVSQQTNLSLKLINAVTILAGLAFLPMSGFVFDTIFQGKYDGGSQVLPFVVFFYVGSGFTALIMNYFWCAHRAPWAVLALVLGVAINMAVNFALVPSLGIVGAAVGTVFGISCQVTALWTMAIWFGLRPDRGTVLIAIASSLLLLDPAYCWIWMGVLVGVVLLPGTLSVEDRQVLTGAYRSVQQRLPLWTKD